MTPRQGISQRELLSLTPQKRNLVTSEEKPNKKCKSKIPESLPFCPPTIIRSLPTPKKNELILTFCNQKIIKTIDKNLFILNCNYPISDSSILNFETLNPSIFADVDSFFKSKKITLTKDNAIGILEYSTVLQAPLLKNKVEGWIVANTKLSEENYELFFSISCLHKVQKLQKEVLKFVIEKKCEEFWKFPRKEVLELDLSDLNINTETLKKICTCFPNLISLSLKTVDDLNLLNSLKKLKNFFIINNPSALI